MAHMNTDNGTLTIMHLISQDKQTEATLKIVEKEYFREQYATFLFEETTFLLLKWNSRVSRLKKICES